MRLLALVPVVLACLTAPLAAQGRSIKVTGVRPLDFGSILAGAPTSVLRTDATRSGRFDFVAQNTDVVIVSLTLPSAMDRAGGGSMPLAFSGSDAGFSQQESVTDQVTFDPRQAYLATMSKTGRGSVFLGGTVTPAFNQAPGSYTALITLTVVYP